ncbi:LacI family transcriptional regulator [Anaerocolumna cellulosilytica]|uniref:LacI family transcriptional regulator n=1 Tax=Anaerocolumna cellulosilytica TaxID=433286 RepID=A0A6S6R5K1_9FIRM|nr:LacI family DNA-binding transcriptional regulator [Anaerocolumna cellulosilytica]MBB5197174.1 DNA-binding LacI/PurR family transcriptional regulator [Anaerocolumna cellulosilytica]BCJ95387.1 LacI family transcriptional regulator [Anaerocolumna cellulosilytica]
MTLKEIAKRADVSISTVSRIINSMDDSFASKAVRDRVWGIIKETGYVPNQSARELKRGKTDTGSMYTRTIACILGRTKNLDDNPFFAQVARAVEQQSLNLGYSVSLVYSILDIENYDLVSRIESIKTDGAIVLGRFSSTSIKFLEKYYKNIVYVGRNVINTSWDQVICDGYEATCTALWYLIECGHKRIAYIGECNNEIRFKAYLDTLHNNNMEVDTKLISECPQNGAGGYQGADWLLKAAGCLPTAVFCATDVCAIAAIRRFTEAGIKIPERLSVISLDNIELAGYVLPMLTTVEMPIFEMGNVAVNTLVERINKRHKLPLKIYLPNKLIIRESVMNTIT